MFRSRVLPSVKPLAKSSFGGHIRGFCRRAADDGHPTPTPTPTTRWGGMMPRPAKFFTVQHQNPSIPRPSIRTISSKMAATKDYRLLCLENPLLGMYTSIYLVLNSRSCQLMARTTPLSPVVVPDRGLGEAPATKASLTMSTRCFTVLCPNPTANPSPSQTSKLSATMRSSPSTASRPTTPSSPRRSTRASSRTCSTTTTPS